MNSFIQKCRKFITGYFLNLCLNLFLLIFIVLGFILFVQYYDFFKIDELIKISLFCIFIAIFLIYVAVFFGFKESFKINEPIIDNEKMRYGIYTELIQYEKRQSAYFDDSINDLKDTGFINLILGIFIGIIGIVVIYWMFTISANIDVTIWTHIEKISPIVIVELLAYFFLRLYRLTVIEIKYLNNERLTYHHKMLALKVALFQNNSEMLADVIKQLAETERNFILQKGETTTGTEGLKQFSDEMKLFSSLLSSLNLSEKEDKTPSK